MRVHVSVMSVCRGYGKDLSVHNYYFRHRAAAVAAAAAAAASSVLDTEEQLRIHKHKPQTKSARICIPVRRSDQRRYWDRPIVGVVWSSIHQLRVFVIGIKTRKETQIRKYRPSPSAKCCHNHSAPCRPFPHLNYHCVSHTWAVGGLSTRPGSAIPVEVASALAGISFSPS